MKSSRAMLLAAMLFVAPVFADNDKADETSIQDVPAQNIPATNANNTSAQNATSATSAQNAPEAPKAEEAKTEAPSWLAAKLAVLTGFGATVADYTVAPVANYTTIPALKQLLRISYLKGGRFEANIPTVGKSIIALGAVVAAYKLYQATQDQDDMDNEDDIFGE